MSKQFYIKQFSLALVRSLKIKTVLFQVIQFSISTQFSSIWLIDTTLSGATAPGQNGPESDSNERVFRIPQNSSITGTSPSYCLVSYPGQSLGLGSYPSAEVQSVYSKASQSTGQRLFSVKIRTLVGRGLTPLQRFSRCILQHPHLPSRLCNS